MDPVLLAVIFLAAAGIFLLISWQVRGQRATELKEWARANKWYYADSDPGLTGHLRGGPIDPAGQTRHILSGSYRDRWILAFEHVPQARLSGQRGSGGTLRMVVVGAPASRPVLDFRPANATPVRQDSAELNGLHEPPLNNRKFSQRFHVRTEDDRFARAFLDTHVTEWLLADSRAQVLPFRAASNDLLTWEQGPLDPDRALQMADYIIDLLDEVADSVWSNYPLP